MGLGFRVNGFWVGHTDILPRKGTTLEVLGSHDSKPLSSCNFRLQGAFWGAFFASEASEICCSLRNLRSIVLVLHI